MSACPSSAGKNTSETLIRYTSTTSGSNNPHSIPAVKVNCAVNPGIERKISADSHVRPRVKPRAALSQDDIACPDSLPAKAFNPEHLGATVSAIAGTALSFLMCHIILNPLCSGL
jgi:hypothetical protein